MILCPGVARMLWYGLLCVLYCLEEHAASGGRHAAARSVSPSSFLLICERKQGLRPIHYFFKGTVCVCMSVRA